MHPLLNCCLIVGALTTGALAQTAATRPTNWHDAKTLLIEGQGWPESSAPYTRLPDSAKGVVRDPVWSLSRCSAGLCVRFVSDSPSLIARWKLNSATLAMDHMPATGMSGLDLYVRTAAGWRWIGTGRPRTAGASQEAVLAEGIPSGLHEYRLYLPLYNGLQTLEIGTPQGVTLSKAQASKEKPICIYGTSITQGGCASRPGMAYPAILGRHLDRPTINLGFSGNGRMEPEMAELLAGLDVAAYVLDCLPNMTTPMVTTHVPPFVHRLRQAHPEVPIILMENIRTQSGHFLPGASQAYTEQNARLRSVFDELTSAGVKRLIYAPSEGLLGDDAEATVDGSHATDLGFLRIADGLEPTMRQALK